MIPLNNFSKLSRYQKPFFLALTIVAGIIILWPLRDFQIFLSQGDHGRDLYCFQKTMEGAVPFRDYSWLFGPLMPYYYALFYKFLGISIQSILLGQNLLVLLTGVVIFFIGTVFLTPLFSFIMAVWYWCLREGEFFYTYNHIGALVAMMSALYFSLRYILEQKRSFIFGGLLSCFIIILIRFNMGITTMAAFLGSVTLADFFNSRAEAKQKAHSNIVLCLLTLTAAFLIYWGCLHTLPNYAIQQSFPFGNSYRTDVNASFLVNLSFFAKFLVAQLKIAIPRMIYAGLLLLSLIQFIHLARKKDLPKEFIKTRLLTFACLLLFIGSSLHEYLLSGVDYRLHWFTPLAVVLMFYIWDAGMQKLPFWTKTLFAGMLFLSAALGIIKQHALINSYKSPQHEFHIGENHIYSCQQPRWYKTVGDVVRFLDTNLKKEETFLAIPFDSLYYYLTQKNSPSRQLVFFEHMNIQPEQEIKIINTMETQNINWVVASNRSISIEQGLGLFGKDYCPLLGAYINQNFELEKTFGMWTRRPSWAWEHGVKILRRKKPL